MLLIVRPYGEWIRDHILQILDASGIATSDHQICDGADPGEVAQTMVGPDVTALLVPYHAERTRMGRFVDGIDVLKAAYDIGLAARRVPVIMPVSVFATVAFEAKLHHQDPAFQHWFERSVCVLHGPFEDHATHVSTLTAWLEHVRR